MSNYPPGVTGMELQIAGPSWEGVIHRECDQRGVTIDVLTDSADAIRTIQAARDAYVRGDLRIALGAVTRLSRSIKQLPMDECPFEDEVDAWEHGGTLHWTCPMCGHEHEESDWDE